MRGWSATMQNSSGSAADAALVVGGRRDPTGPDIPARYVVGMRVDAVTYETATRTVSPASTT